MKVQNNIVLNSDLGGLSFFEDSTGKYVVGADSVPKNWVVLQLRDILWLEELVEVLVLGK